MSIFLGRRNYQGLTERQIELCRTVWDVLCGQTPRALVTDSAHLHGSRTRFMEELNATSIGADVYPGDGPSANSRMSMPACLAHEMSHVQRFERGYRRPHELPDALIDEAETSLNASFHDDISLRDREDLIQDAHERLIEWLKSNSNKEDDHEEN